MNAAPEIEESRAVGNPTFRAEIDRLAASRGIDLGELHRRFIEGGYGAVDRYDRNISLWRFEQHANGETGGLNQRFVWGLDRALGLTDEECVALAHAYLRDVFDRA